MNVTVNINMDAKCAECRKGGATPCGLCLKCVTKTMDPRAVMKTAQGKAVQERWKRQFDSSPKTQSK